VRESLAPTLATIRARCAFRAPKVALVLGSGLGELAANLEESIEIPYRDLPGFPQTMVEGHGGELVLGRLAGCEVAVMRGRTHYYQTGRADGMRDPLGVLRALGCETIVLTNAAASLRPEVAPGSLMLITDHINFSGTNPLIGRDDPARFVDLTAAYDPVLRARMLSAAGQRKIALHQGVYMWFSGPSFETPAEIRAAKALGADAVGMSTVPEAILARHCGLKVVALSAITNLGAGMDERPLDHRQTLEMATEAANDLGPLLEAFLQEPEP
jgi:purine-nucleoside phosphorylase